MLMSPSQTYLHDSNQTFVDVVYNRTLGFGSMFATSGSSTALATYTNQLDTAAFTPLISTTNPYGVVARQIATSVDGSGNHLYNAFAAPSTAPIYQNIYNGISDQVCRIYHATLHREPDYPGLQYYINNLIAGDTLIHVADTFIHSPAFQALVPATSSNSTFITSLYRSVLGRAPLSTELSFWNHDMAAGDSRAGVVIQFTESDEYIRKTYGTTNTESIFAALAERMPTTSELLRNASGFQSNTLFEDAANAAVYNGILPQLGTVVISGPVPDNSTLDLQAGTRATVGKAGTTIITLTDATTKPIGEATPDSLHVFDLSHVTFGKGLTIIGTAYDDIITAPSGGGVVEPMAGNDKIFLSATASTTIVFGDMQPLISGVAAPYNNGADVIGYRDMNGVVQGAFKPYGKTAPYDVLDFHNFLGGHGQLLGNVLDIDVPVQHLPGATPDIINLGANRQYEIIVVVTQHPEDRANIIAGFNNHFILPNPDSHLINNQLNYVIVATSHNATSDTYVWGMEHISFVQSNPGLPLAPQHFNEDTDRLDLLVTLVGVTTSVPGPLAPQTVFAQGNFL